MLRVRAFSGRVPSDSLRRDPFDTFPAPATTEVYLALDHCKIPLPKGRTVSKTLLDIQVIASLYGAFVTPAGYDGNALLGVVVPVSLQNVYLFHTLVAHSRLTHLMARDGTGIGDTVVIYHHSQALAALQLAVQDINDDTVPLAVIQLLQIEVKHRLFTSFPYRRPRGEIAVLTFSTAVPFRQYTGYSTAYSRSAADHASSKQCPSCDTTFEGSYHDDQLGEYQLDPQTGSCKTVSATISSTFSHRCGLNSDYRFRCKSLYPRTHG